MPKLRGGSASVWHKIFCFTTFVYVLQLRQNTEAQDYFIIIRISLRTRYVILFTWGAIPCFYDKTVYL